MYIVVLFVAVVVVSVFIVFIVIDVVVDVMEADGVLFAESSHSVKM